MNPDEHWSAKAACRGNPGPWEYGASKADQHFALDTCWNHCPVDKECDADLRSRDERPDGGVWAGQVIPPKKKPRP